jgi:hypothetical protein
MDMNYGVLITDTKEKTANIELARGYWKANKGNNNITKNILVATLKSDISDLMRELDNEHLSLNDLNEIQEYINKIYK